MPRNNSHDAIVAHRRRRVAALRLGGLTQREITEALPLGKNPIVNPISGEPYALGTINRDVMALEQKWERRAVEDIALAKAMNLAETREARRAAWQKGLLSLVYRGLEHEANLLGLNDRKDASALRALEDLVNAWDEGMASEEDQDSIDNVRTDP